MLAKLAVKSLDAYNRLTPDEEGASLVEYGLLVGLIAVVCIGAVQALGLTINGLFMSINATLGG